MLDPKEIGDFLRKYFTEASDEEFLEDYKEFCMRDADPDAYDLRDEAATLHNLSGIYQNRGEVEKAIEFYEKSLELFERIGDVRGKAATLHQLAGIYEHRGEVEKAIEFYERSSLLYRKIGRR